MGIFFVSQPAKPVVQEEMLNALRENPQQIVDIESEADSRSSKVASQLSENRTFKAARFLGAIAIFIIVAVGAYVAETNELTESTKALWGLAASIFGVIVGILGGESAVRT